MASTVLRKVASVSEAVTRTVTPTPEHDQRDAGSPGQASAIPDRLGRFRVLRSLGQGGMGSVLLAEDEQLQRRVALKILRRDVIRSTDEIEALRREAQALARLCHPNVVAVYGLERSEESLFIAMEYVPGCDLKEWMSARKRSPEEILRAFRAAARGLAAAHEHDLVHRDFKPANVLVGADDRISIADFGLATAARGQARATWADSGGALISEARSLTAGHVVMGTPRYMAPEQHDGRPADARADQYAFFVALAEALLGHPPFQVPVVQLRDTKVAGIARDMLARLPWRVRRVVARELAPDPGQRFPNMNVVRERLAEPRRLRSSVAAFTALVTPLAVWTGPERENCSIGSERVAATWNPARARALQASYAGDALTRDGSARIDVALQSWRDRWSRVFEEVCERRDRVPATAYDAQMLCLKRRERGFQAQVEALLDDPPADVTVALDAVLALPSPFACRDPDRVGQRNREQQSPPPHLVAEVDAMDDEVEQVSAAIRFGRYQQALEMALALRPRARALGFAPLVNEIDLLVVRGLDATQQIDPAIEASQSLYFAALEHEQLFVAVATANLLADMLAHERNRTEDAERWLRFAWSLLRDWPDEAMIAETFRQQGVVRIQQGRSEAALVDFAAALEHLTPQDEAWFAVMSARASALLELGRVGEATDPLDRLLAAQVERYGPRHPEHEPVLASLGRCYVETSDPEPVEAIARRLIAHHDVNPHDPRSDIEGWSLLASTYMFRDQFDQAQEAIDRALGFVPDDATGKIALLGLRRRNHAAKIALQRGDLDRAETLLIRVLRDSPPDIMDHDRAGIMFALGYIRSQRGHPEQALVWFARSQAALDRLASTQTPRHRIELTYAWAEALVALGREEEARGHLEYVLESPPIPNTGGARGLAQKLWAQLEHGE